MYKTNHTGIDKMNAKLYYPHKVSKTFWSIVNRFLNETNTRTIPQGLVCGKLTTDFDKKTFSSTFCGTMHPNLKYEHTTCVYFYKK